MWAIVACLIAYAVLRIILIPSGPEVTRSFSHDSAYIAIVARNVLAGRGLVNDASWLVFLNPPALPMAFHNANPLYILTTAAAAWLTNGDVVRAGLIVSAVSSALLVGAVMWLVSCFTTRRVALVVAVGTALFPPVYQLSLSMLPDALCLALSVAFVAAFVREQQRWTWIAAGVLFGLAWLTRSSSSLLLPAVFVYGVLAWGFRRTMIRCVSVGVAAFVVVSPWLWHSYQVWGNPLRSDVSYYLIQDIVVDKLGPVTDDALLRYWHGTVVPPSMGSVVAQAPVWFVRWVAMGTVQVALALAKAWAASSMLTAGLIALLVLAALLQVPKHWRRPEWIAAAVYVATTVGIFAIRPRSVEVRYLALVSILGAIVFMAVTVHAIADLRRGKRGTPLLIAAAGLVFWVAVVPFSDVSLSRLMRQPNADRIAQRAIHLRVRDLTPTGPVVVESPYFYSYDTQRQALSIPDSDDRYLMSYMNRYGARTVLLSDAELAFWRPAWSKGQLPGELHVVERFPKASLFGVAAAP